MEIKKIKVNKRIRKDLGDLSDLKNSIEEIGLLQPIVIDKENNLIAGERRLASCKELGMDDIDVNIVDLKNTFKGECDENMVRKNFTPTEMVDIWEAMEKAKGGRSKTVPESGKVLVKKTLGVGYDKLSQAKQVIEFGDTKLIEEMDKTGNVNKAYKEVKREQAKIDKKEFGIPKGKYEIIYLDPPWKYDKDEAYFGQDVERHYPTMNPDEIYKLPLKEMAYKDCVLYMWATAPKLNIAMKAIEAWGFDYKTCLVWDKVKHNMGYYASIRHEILLIAGVGSTAPTEKSFANQIDSVYVEERTEHSKKPAYFYEIIEGKHPLKTKRIELFSREKRRGWEAWGNEV